MKTFLVSKDIQESEKATHRMEKKNICNLHIWPGVVLKLNNKKTIQLNNRFWI